MKTNFLKVNYEENTYLINLDNVLFIEPVQIGETDNYTFVTKTRITFIDHTLIVDETFEEIYSKIFV